MEATLGIIAAIVIVGFIGYKIYTGRKNRGTGTGGGTRPGTGTGTNRER